MDCVRNENGNHVIQVAVRVIPFQHIHFMVDVFYGEVDYLATHRYGCRVIQRLLEKVEAPLMISRLMHGLHQCSPQLIADQYGNYVPQHIMETGGPVDRDMVVNVVLKNLFSYSKQKFASNVVEKCVKHGNDHQRRQMMIELSADDGQSENKLLFLIRDGYGNYVIRKSTRWVIPTVHVNNVSQSLCLITSMMPTIGRSRPSLSRKSRKR